MVDPIGTVPALDLLTQDQLDQLFDQKTGYMAKVEEQFSLLDAMDEAENANKGNGNNNNNNNNNNNSNNNNAINKSGDDPPNENEPKLRRKHSRSASLITDKKTLILDVDNTLIYVRHFMDEMRVNDSVRLGDKQARVKKLTYRLDLEFTEAGQMSVYDHIITSADEHIPQRSDWFPDEITKVALIHQADPTGCEIELLDEYEDVDDDKNNKNDENSDNTDSKNDSNENKDDSNTNNSNDNDKNAENNDGKKKLKTIEISFLKNSKELSQLEPMMNRPDHVEVDFMYGGYLVRIRPNLATFLANCNTMFDVILFTAADGSVYKGLLHQVHELLKQKLDEIKNEIDVPVPEKLWSEIYFRDDCDEKYDEHGLPYRHKNLSKLGRDLSTIVMVDDNPLSYRGYEPNAMRVAGFWGQAHPPDDELTQTLLPTLITVSKQKDVRYHLSGLEPPSDNESEQGKSAEDSGRDTDEEIEHQRKHSREASSKFLDTLKKALDEDEENADGVDDDDDDDDDDSLDDSQSSGKDLEQAENEHANSDAVNGLLPHPKQSTRTKKQQKDINGKDDVMSDQELAKMATYSRGHSDSVRIRNDVNDAGEPINTNNNNNANKSNTEDLLDMFDNGGSRSSMASDLADGVVFYNADDDSGRPLKPLNNNNIENSARYSELGTHILQPSSGDLDILQFEPASASGAGSEKTEKTPSAATITDITEDPDQEQEQDQDQRQGRRDSVEMYDDNDQKQEDNNEQNNNDNESNSHESRSQSASRTDDEEKKDTNNNSNRINETQGHATQDSAALNAKYGFVSVNDKNNEENNNNNNENENNNINDNNNNSPDYVSSGNIVNENDNNMNNELYGDNHYPLTDDEDVGKSSSCLCFSLFSKSSKKKSTKYTKSGPMSQQDSIR